MMPFNRVKRCNCQFPILHRLLESKYGVRFDLLKLEVMTVSYFQGSLFFLPILTHRRNLELFLFLASAPTSTEIFNRRLNSIFQSVPASGCPQQKSAYSRHENGCSCQTCTSCPIICVSVSATMFRLVTFAVDEKLLVARCAVLADGTCRETLGDT